MLATAHGVFEALVEFVGFDVGRDDVFDCPTDQVLALVEHFIEKILVDRTNPPVGLKGQREHFAFQAFLHLYKAGEFFTESGQLLLQAIIEHGKAPMAG